MSIVPIVIVIIAGLSLFGIISSSKGMGITENKDVKSKIRGINSRIQASSIPNKGLVRNSSSLNRRVGSVNREFVPSRLTSSSNNQFVKRFSKVNTEVSDVYGNNRVCVGDTENLGSNGHYVSDTTNEYRPEVNKRRIKGINTF